MTESIPSATQLDLARNALKQVFPASFSDKEDEPMTYYMVEGYFFSLACAPILVGPSDCMQTVFSIVFKQRYL